jgi:hypothetical protein
VISVSAPLAICSTSPDKWVFALNRLTVCIRITSLYWLD